MKTLKRILGILVMAAAILAMASPVYARGWESPKVEKDALRQVASDTEIEIRAGSGIIYVTTTRNINIKIYTILGSRIADDTLSPGSYQFMVPTHGVYLIKAADLTCKIAV